jgi:hypothetical protein
MSGCKRNPRRDRSSTWNRTSAFTTTTTGALILRDDWTCAYCARRLAFDDLELDHVVPRLLGGSSKPENLVVSCSSCNLARGAGPVPVHAQAEVARRLAIPLDRVAGRALGDQLYPWAAARREREAKDGPARRRRRREEAERQGLSGAAFPFGDLATREAS